VTPKRRVSAVRSRNVDTRCRSGTEKGFEFQNGQILSLWRGYEGSVTASSTSMIGMLSRTG
jgi:hypothetical protein